MPLSNIIARIAEVTKAIEQSAITHTAMLGQLQGLKESKAIIEAGVTVAETLNPSLSSAITDVGALVSSVEADIKSIEPAVEAIVSDVAPKS